MSKLRIFSVGLILISLFAFTGCETVEGWFADENDPGEYSPDKPYDTMDVGVDEENVFLEPGQPLGTREDGWTPVPNADFPVVYFAYNRNTVGASEKRKLDTVADYMMKNKGIGLIIEGHCDERGSKEYNRALGEKRAISVKDYLIGCGIDTMRLRTVSFGEDRPAIPETTESAFQKNRRAELIPAKMK